MKLFLSCLALFLTIGCYAQSTTTPNFSLRFSNDLGSNIVAHTIYVVQAESGVSDTETYTRENQKVNEFIAVCSEVEGVNSCTFDHATGTITVVAKKGVQIEEVVTEFNMTLEK